MKTGVEEFRERLGEFLNGTEPVAITQNGRVVGHYFPSVAERGQTRDLSDWADDMERRRDEWRAKTPNWREMMRDAGLDPDYD